MSDRILIRGLVVAATVGVPDLERAAPQRLEIDLELVGDFRGLDDEVARTTDYAAVAEWVRRRCGGREFRLLESLADDLACGLLAMFPHVMEVGLEIRKFVLPAAQSVGVAIRRERL